jgi:DegV family protein with EDD domain
MTAGVRIVTDSASDLPDAIVERLGIVVVPLTIRFGTQEFVDRRDLDAHSFWQQVKATDTLPETAAPAPGDFAEAYRRLADEGASGIVVITLSGDLSGTLSSAQVAARTASIPVEVVDSRSVTMGQGLTVMVCAEAAAGGASMADVVAKAQDLSGRTRVLGALDSLEHLRKGGRIGGAKAMLASALSIKPLIDVRAGRVEEGGRQRTRSKALAWLVDQVRECPRMERLAVMHAECDDVDAFVASLRALGRDDLGDTIVIGDLGAVVGTHSGPRTIGVAFHVAPENPPN